MYSSFEIDFPAVIYLKFNILLWARNLFSSDVKKEAITRSQGSFLFSPQNSSDPVVITSANSAAYSSEELDVILNFGISKIELFSLRSSMKHIIKQTVSINCKAD